MDVNFYFDKNMHGLLVWAFGDYTVHFWVKPEGRLWGTRFTMEGAAIREWGFGPLLLVVRFEGKT